MVMKATSIESSVASLNTKDPCFLLLKRQNNCKPRYAIIIATKSNMVNAGDVLDVINMI